MRRAVCIDRDGVLIEHVQYSDTNGWDSPRTPNVVRVIPEAAKAVALLNTAGIPVFLVSNQPGIAKGKFTLDDHAAMIKRLDEDLRGFDAKLDGHYYCLHHPDPKQVRVREFLGECECRKPKPGLFKFIKKDHEIDLPTSWMIGDRSTDVAAGKAVGMKTILIENGDTNRWRTEKEEKLLSTVFPDLVVASVSDAVKVILEKEATDANRTDQNLHRLSGS